MRVSDVIAWLAAIISAQNLAKDIRAASGRITELVGSVKVYSHMDRAGDRERIDLREGIDSTLVMLGHKLKRKNITLERVYAPDLPQVQAFAGELNQVWTNLADNAIDAMSDQRRAADRGGAGRGRGRGADHRQRRRHSGRRAAANLRGVLHHQAAG